MNMARQFAGLLALMGVWLFVVCYASADEGESEANLRAS